ncbi:flagellar protein FlgN [Salicibibacter cibarius]|uniref:Flagellar protein FlgN n=1 Tax=Salicibibacter cibarius TaxID=2743000 RepID=A0A7T7CDE2_9BACI|nr:flagellar protein FlgN [Salicibibacter cibarius]QQK77909.1 flagellar protein FlgN [Salicibibacter cibarius]
MNEIVALKENLENLIHHHEYLLTLAGKKTKAIQRSDRKALEEIVRLEQGEARTLRQLEKERRRVVTTFIDHHCPHLEADAPMMQWVSYVPEKERLEVEKQRERLQTAIRHLQAKNNLNQQLLNDGLAFVSAMLDAIRFEDYTMYTSAANTKKTNEHERFSTFDSRA